MSAKFKKKLDDLENKVIGNVECDRDTSERLLTNIHDYLYDNKSSMSGEEYSKIIASAAKVVENLQKSNEQILRILEAHNKKKIAEETSELSRSEIESIYKEEVVETHTGH